jgi:hypothetical protein
MQDAHQEARMAPTHPGGLNRRQLLGSAAGVVVTGIVPGIDTRPDAAAAEVVVPASTPTVLNVCPATAARIAEIAARNRIREEAGLPLLSVPRELRRMSRCCRVRGVRGEASDSGVG